MLTLRHRSLQSGGTRTPVAASLSACNLARAGAASMQTRSSPLCKARICSRKGMLRPLPRKERRILRRLGGTDRMLASPNAAGKQAGKLMSMPGR